MKNKPLKSCVPFLARLAGAAPDIYFRCSNSEKTRIQMIGAVLIFTPMVSALIMAGVIARLVLRNLLWYPFGLLLWGGLVFFIDRLMLGSRQGRMAQAFRLVSALVFASFHMLLLGLWLFKPDIQRAIQADHLNAKMKGQKQFTLHRDALRREAKTLDSLIVAENQRLIEANENLKREADGTGGSFQRGIAGIYRRKEQLEQYSRARSLAAIGIYQRAIRKIEQEMQRLEEQEKAWLLQLPAAGASGPIEQLRVMHSLLFEEGAGHKLLLYILLFLCCCCFEGLPLIARYAYPLENYRLLEVAEEQLNAAFEELGRQARSGLQQEAVIAAFEKGRYEIQRHIAVEKLQETLLRIRQELDEKERFLEWLAAKKTQMQQHFPDYGRQVEYLVGQAMQNFEEVA